MSIKNESLTITSRAEAAFSGLENVFEMMYSRKDFDRVMRQVKTSSPQARATRYLKDLYTMFDDCEIEYEQGRDNDYYADLIDEKVTPDKYDDGVVEDKLIMALFSRFEGYSTPSDYMDRILVRLLGKEDKEKWKYDSLRLKLLKQFIKYGYYLNDAGYGSRPYIERYVAEKSGRRRKELTANIVVDVVDETIFDEFDEPCQQGMATQYRNDRRTNGRFGLLKLCDDLALGKFRTNGATKKGLYLLAIVLEMKLAGFPGADKENDVVKNLFRDYYANNLMRYMTDAYKGHGREFENPSGQGINYKNFAEMVYLYYIAKEGMTPQKKIKASNDMINELIEEAINNRRGGKKESVPQKATELYRKRFMYKDPESGAEIFSEDIFAYDEDMFKKFLLENYDCDTGTGNTFITRGVDVEIRIGALQLETDQNTAYSAYNDILAKLVDELDKNELTLSYCNYGLWFVDVAAYKKEGLESIPDRYPEVDKELFDRFMDVLMGANLMVGTIINESESNRTGEHEHAEASITKPAAFSIHEPKDITRTYLMTVFYYYFNTLYEDSNQLNWKSYADLFKEFKNRLDPILVACGYQEVSGKNLFDAVLTFSSYARLVL